MINYNFDNCLKDNYLVDGIKVDRIDRKQEKEIKKVFINKSREMMGWLDLPYQDKEYINSIQTFGFDISNLYDNFVVLGIGGSALGARAIYNSLKEYDKNENKKNKTKIIVADYIDSEKFENLINNIDITKTMFNVVSKSGNTVETLSQFSIVLNLLKKVLNNDWNKNIVVTTEKDNYLWNYSVLNNIKTFEVPKEVGGRFSVFTPVGLLPSAVMGLNLQKLLIGAKNIYEHFLCEEGNQNIPFVSAYIINEYIKKGRNEIVLMPYSDRLNDLADFYIQLLGESLGKENLLDNSKNKKFITPIKSIGVKGQHSDLQLFQEGINNKIFCFFTVKKRKGNIKIPKFKNEKLDKFLPNSLNELFDAELKATELALKQHNRPCFEISIADINENSIGELIMYFELTTATLAEFLNVNCYNQPGVELEKKYTKALIGVNGFEEEKEKLDKIISKENSFCLQIKNK